MNPVRTTGAHALLRLLGASGIRYIFGNPGSTELPLMDALADEAALQYVLALQEVPAVAMADGYAQASGSPGVVNLHIACGLGNGMGMLFNAWRAGTPLVVTAGQQDRRLAFEEPVLWGDLVRVTRPWTKWSAEITRLEDLPSAIRRALQIAMTPPTGPVFLALPVDMQMEEAELDLTPGRSPTTLIRPPLEELRRAAEALVRARAPAIIAGARVCECGAIGELVAVAERLGAPVYHDSIASHGRCSFPPAHPLAAGLLPLWSPNIRQRLDGHDVVLAVGVDLLQQYIYHEPSRAIPENAVIIHMDQNPGEIGKNYPVAAAVWSHPKPGLSELECLLAVLMTSEHVKAARTRAERTGEAHASQRRALRDEAATQRAVRPLTPLCLMDSLARALPDHAAVIEEAPTTSGSYLERAGLLRTPEGHFSQRGWALGWGLNCAIGVKVAWPERAVLAVVGDGSMLYGCQGLWTAARYGLPVTCVVTNNSEYRILKACGKLMNLPNAAQGRFVGLDLDQPAVDFPGLARSFGVEARRISEPDELTDAVRESLAGDTPRLFEVPVRHPEPSPGL